LHLLFAQLFDGGLDNLFFDFLDRFFLFGLLIRVRVLLYLLDCDL